MIDQVLQTRSRTAVSGGPPQVLSPNFSATHWHDCIAPFSVT